MRRRLCSKTGVPQEDMGDLVYMGPTFDGALNASGTMRAQCARWIVVRDFAYEGDPAPIHIVTSYRRYIKEVPVAG